MDSIEALLRASQATPSADWRAAVRQAVEAELQGGTAAGTSARPAAPGSGLLRRRGGSSAGRTGLSWGWVTLAGALTLVWLNGSWVARSHPSAANREPARCEASDLGVLLQELIPELPPEERRRMTLVLGGQVPGMAKE